MDLKIFSERIERILPTSLFHCKCATGGFYHDVLLMSGASKYASVDHAGMSCSDAATRIEQHLLVAALASGNQLHVSPHTSTLAADLHALAQATPHTTRNHADDKATGPSRPPRDMHVDFHLASTKPRNSSLLSDCAWCHVMRVSMSSVLCE